jgi:hemerythrin-like domain-containing protein
MSDSLELGRPTDGDVVDLILDDHRRFEAMLRDLRDASQDRDAARRAFSALHVAHAEAEESKVYPTLRRKDAIGEHEEEHGEEEHAEGHQALLEVLEADDLQSEDFDELAEKLATAVNHHLSEEELTILNPAREDVTEDVRQRLGTDFATERNSQLDADCGRLENVRAIVARAGEKGLLSGE